MVRGVANLVRAIFAMVHGIFATVRGLSKLVREGSNAYLFNIYERPGMFSLFFPT